MKMRNNFWNAVAPLAGAVLLEVGGHYAIRSVDRYPDFNDVGERTVTALRDSSISDKRKAIGGSYAILQDFDDSMQPPNVTNLENSMDSLLKETEGREVLASDILYSSFVNESASILEDNIFRKDAIMISYTLLHASAISFGLISLAMLLKK